MCIILNEFPYIRYYQPTHHAPLGPLVPNASFLPPPPKEGTGRWRTNLARGAVAREYEHAENEYVSRSLACLVQQALEEHEKSNPEFPVRSSSFFSFSFFLPRSCFRPTSVSPSSPLASTIPCTPTLHILRIDLKQTDWGPGREEGRVLIIIIIIFRRR